MKQVTLKLVKSYIKEGHSANQIAELFGIKYSELNTTLAQHDSSIRKLKQELGIKPQIRAWKTIHKNRAMEAYQSATSSGIKASVSRKFRKEYGLDIKSEISKTEIAKILSEKVEPIAKVESIEKKAIKENFLKKEVELMIPRKMLDLIEAQNKKIKELTDRVWLLEYTARN